MIDLLRKSMRREAELDGAQTGEEGPLRRLFDDRMRVPADRSESGLLTETSRVEVVYRKDGDRFLLCWSQDGAAQPIARLVNGAPTLEEGRVLERFPVRIYSQKQLFALARNPNALLAVLDDTPEVSGADAQRELKRLEDRYLALRAEARQALTHARELPDRKASLDDVQRKLDLLQQGGHAEVLQLYRSHRRADDTWKAVQASSAQGLDAVREAVSSIAVPDLNLPIGDDDATHALQRAHQSLYQLIEDFRGEMLDSIEDVRERQAEVLRGADASQWSAAVDASEEAYQTTVSRLREEGISDPDEYRELVDVARGLETEIESLRTEEQRARRLEQEANAVLTEYRQARSQLSVKRQEFARRVSGDTLHVEVKDLAEHSDLVESLGRILGIEAFNEDRRLLSERIRPQGGGAWDWGLLDGVVDEMRAFQSGDSESWATKDARFAPRLQGLPAERIDRLALYLPDDVLEVRFRSRSSAQWRPIAQGSPGQQTAALLAFVLGFGSEPIVLGSARGRLGQHAHIRTAGQALPGDQAGEAADTRDSQPEHRRARRRGIPPLTGGRELSDRCQT